MGDSKKNVITTKLPERKSKRALMIRGRDQFVIAGAGGHTSSMHLTFMETPEYTPRQSLLNHHSDDDLNKIPEESSSTSTLGNQRIPEIGPPLGETGTCIGYNYLGDKKMDPLVIFVRKHTPKQGWKMYKIERSLAKMLRQEYLSRTNFWDATWHPMIFTEFEETVGSIRAGEPALIRQLDSLNHALLFGRKQSVRGTMVSSTLLEHYLCFKTSLKGPAAARYARKQFFQFGFRPYYNALKKWYRDNRVRMYLFDAWDRDNQKMIRDLTMYMIDHYRMACAVVLRVVTGYHWIKQWDTCHFPIGSRGGLTLQCWLDCMLDMAYHLFQGDSVMRVPEHVLNPSDTKRMRASQMVYIKREDGRGMVKVKKEKADKEPAVSTNDSDVFGRPSKDAKHVGSGKMQEDGRLFGEIGEERPLPVMDSTLEKNAADMFLYPHGKRFVSGTELVDLTNLVLRGNIWRDVRPTTKDRVSHIVHLLFTKTRHHKCLVRNIEDILKDYCSSDPLLKCLVKDILHISMMGNWPAAKVRPGFLARMYIRRDSLVFFHVSERHTSQWFKENQRLLWYALKEYYLYTVDMTPAVLQRVQTSQWHIEHASGVRDCMDAVRAAMCVDYRRQSLIVHPSSSLSICDVASFELSPQTMTRLRGIVSRTHAAQLKYMTKLRKGSFARVLFKEMRSWDSREDKCAALLKMYPNPPESSMDILDKDINRAKSMVYRPPSRARGRHPQQEPCKPPLRGTSWPNWDRTSAEEDRLEYIKEVNTRGQESQNSSYSTSDEEDEDTIDKPRRKRGRPPKKQKRRTILPEYPETDTDEDDDDDDDLLLSDGDGRGIDNPKPLLFKVKPPYPQYIVDMVQYGEANHRRPTEDELSAIRVAAEYAKTREDHVFEFWWLYPLGVSRAGLNWLKHIYYLFEVKDLPDNQLKTRIENLYGKRPKDFYLLLRFLFFYLKSDVPDVVWLGTEVASHQIEACRARYRMMPWEPTDLALIGDRYYCRCGEWGDPIMSPISRKRTIHAIGITGGYYDTKDKTVHCKRDKSLCVEHPYRKINMIGVAVCVANRYWVTLCATCGVITKWCHESYSEKGPDCGNHREDAENAMKYHGVRAYIHHGYEMSTPERPYQVGRPMISTLRKKQKLHRENPDKNPSLTPHEENMWRHYHILSPIYRDRLAIARRENYADVGLGYAVSTHHCIYCMRRIPPGGGASILVIKNGLDEVEDQRRYDELCDMYGRVLNRASTDSIYQQTNYKLWKQEKDDENKRDRHIRRMSQSTSLELVRLCAVDWRNVRKRIFFDSTTVPFLEDLFRWIDSRRRKKTLLSAHWGKRRMIHQHHYRHENKRAARSTPAKRTIL
jgi:hypothetical protein